MADDEQTQQITLMMTELATKMQVLLDKQEELGENISKIKEAVYEPDKGLYARLSTLSARLDSLELWKGNNSKILWIVVTVSTGLVLSTIWQGIVS
jgi:arginine decarboxylase-like protein|tara:strand:- start:843 stop:1130 length:288 start_codon:yes stop_codon:yes gene_type:complete